MNKLFCFLSGGHRYKASDLRVYEIPTERRIAIKQFCCKCGAEKCISVPIDNLFTEKEKILLGYSPK